MFCEGRRDEDVCKADMVEAADGPEEVVATDCGLAVDIPAMGSDFDGGHKPLVGFSFRWYRDEASESLLVDGRLF